ncbi:DNA-binding HxlR family transcriptional regulator [Mucilaginibacter sp. UYNi724]
MGQCKELITPECVKDMKYLQDTLYVISGKWKMLIIISLHNGSRHYREIARTLPNITFRMLSKELRELEQNKLITRAVHDEASLKIEYNITAYCQSLIPLISEMIKWGKAHRKVIWPRPL